MGAEFEAIVPALDNKVIKLKVNYMKDLGTYAAWKATKTTGQFDLKTFEVRGVPMEPVETYVRECRLSLRNKVYEQETKEAYLPLACHEARMSTPRVKTAISLLYGIGSVVLLYLLYHADGFGTSHRLTCRCSRFR